MDLAKELNKKSKQTVEYEDDRDCSWSISNSSQNLEKRLKKQKIRAKNEII